MTQGLPVSRLINVSLSLSQALSGFANLNTTVLLGEGGVNDPIDVQTRIVPYSSAAAVAAQFGGTAPETLAAQAFFSQTPQPAQVYIGKWAHVATKGRLVGAPLPSTALATLKTFTIGAFKITVDALAPLDVTGMNFSGATNLNGVATIIQTAMNAAGAQATVTYNGTQFVFQSKTTGVTSKIAPLTAAASGQGVGPALGCDALSNPRTPTGAAAETALAAVQALDTLGTYYYALNTDACPDLLDADDEAIAAYIEASQATAAHIYCFTNKDPNALSSSVGTDCGTVLHNSGYQRTFVQWSSTSLYACCSEIALFMTVDLEGSNTMITAAYKQEPGITPEQLSTAQANALDASGYNYYAMFNNGVPVLVNGCMICTSIVPGGGSNEVFIDEMLGADGLANAIQTDYFNLLGGVPKLPQTDAGSHLGANAIEQACDQFVTNGFLGPGYWQAGGFGQLATGSFLSKGYYVYTPPIFTQAQADRAARKSVPYQVAAKTAGAIHTANIAVTVNP
jgi:Protein of unknown function (DUF3383)